jgi:fructokinase
MIVVAGEALIDLIPTVTGELTISVGGGPFNTARWLGRLGQPVGFLGAISADLLGAQIRASLIEAGVLTDQLIETSYPTTLALAQLDEAGAAQYSFYTDHTSVPDVTPEQAAAVLPPQLSGLQVGGIGMMVEPMASAVESIVGPARERGALVMLDPNVRPSLIIDRGRYVARLYRVISKCHVLKLSVEDLAWIAPGEEPLAAARYLAARGPEVVLLTAGAAGVTVLCANQVAHLNAQAVNVVDTIGAGDAYGAGFLANWLAGEKTPRNLNDMSAVIGAASFAAQVAAIACAHQGGTPPPRLVI